MPMVFGDGLTAVGALVAVMPAFPHVRYAPVAAMQRIRTVLMPAGFACALPANCTAEVPISEVAPKGLNVTYTDN